MLQLETIDDVAGRTRLSPVTITHWAYGRRPAPKNFPNPIKVGRQVRYIAAQIDEWILAQAEDGSAPRGLPSPDFDLSRIKAANDDGQASPARKRGRPRKTRAVGA